MQAGSNGATNDEDAPSITAIANVCPLTPSVSAVCIATGKTTKGAAKYANPANPEQTWTGRGRKPNWVIEALDNGKSIEDLAI